MMLQVPRVLVEQAVQLCMHLHQSLWHTHSGKVTSQTSCRWTLNIKKEFKKSELYINSVKICHCNIVSLLLKEKSTLKLFHQQRLTVSHNVFGLAVECSTSGNLSQPKQRKMQHSFTRLVCSALHQSLQVEFLINIFLLEIVKYP